MSYQERVIAEKDALEIKLNDLSNFLTDLENKTITIDITDEHIALLHTQLLHMTGYLTALIARIKLFGVVQTQSTEIIGTVTDNTSEIIGYVAPITDTEIS